MKNASQETINNFHRLYYDSMQQTWQGTWWLGVPALKCPLDLWVYQEILVEKKPDLIIETGTYQGGSALFLASICDLLGNGKVLSVDVENRQGKPKHPRIRYLLGSSTSDSVVNEVRFSFSKGDMVMVILDSDHAYTHVLDELRVYGDMVTSGQYLIVEDTNIGHPILPQFGLGPFEAARQFLTERSDFTVDEGREKFFLTFNSGGYLRKIR